MIRLLIFAITMLLLSSICNGQGRTTFGASRAQDTSLTVAQVKFSAYGGSLDTMLMIILPNGDVKKVAKNQFGSTVNAGFGLIKTGSTIYVDTSVIIKNGGNDFGITTGVIGSTSGSLDIIAYNDSKLTLGNGDVTTFNLDLFRVNDNSLTHTDAFRADSTATFADYPSITALGTTGTGELVDNSGLMVKYTDTTAMLAPYLRKIDTVTFSTGLTQVGKIVTANLSTGVASANQTAIGSTLASGTLTLSSTSNATKGKILFGTSAYDEANNRLGVGIDAPTTKLHVYENVNTATVLRVENPNTGSSASSVIRAVSDVGLGDLRVYSSTTTGMGLEGQTTLQSLKGIIFMASAGGESGGTDNITFRTGGYLSSQERMRLLSNGRLLIGTTTDAGQLLQVNGTSSFTGTATFATDITVNSMRVGTKSITGATFMGVQAGNANTTGINTFIGYQSGLAATTGSGNTGIGNSTLKSITTTNSNTAVGNESQAFQTGTMNTSLGSRALYANTGNNNTGIGTSALNDFGAGDGNTALGSLAGYNIATSSSNNTFLGFGAGAYSNGSGNVFMGKDAGSSAVVSNKLYIDNSNTSTPLIGGDFSSNLVTIGGDLLVNTATDAGNYAAQINGNLLLTTAGNKINITTGSNASIGTSTLVGGTVTVSTTAVTASSKIFITVATPGGTQGFLSVPTASITAGTSFVINSTSATETSTVNWWIIN